MIRVLLKVRSQSAVAYPTQQSQVCQHRSNSQNPGTWNQLTNKQNTLTYYYCFSEFEKLFGLNEEFKFTRKLLVSLSSLLILSSPKT